MLWYGKNRDCSVLQLFGPHVSECGRLRFLGWFSSFGKCLQKARTSYSPEIFGPVRLRSLSYYFYLFIYIVRRHDNNDYSF